MYRGVRKLNIRAESIWLDLGEEVHVYAEVTCGEKVPFVVRDAKYVFIDPEGNIEAQGMCEVDGHRLDVFLMPQMAGDYKLKYTYKVADETWVDVVKVKVR